MTEKLQRRDALSGVNPNLDAGTDAAIRGMKQAEEERRLPKKERNKLKRQRERAEARQKTGRRWSLDIPVDIKENIRAMALKERTTESQIVALACARFIADVEAGNVDIDQYKRPSRSPKFDWLLDAKK